MYREFRSVTPVLCGEGPANSWSKAGKVPVARQSLGRRPVLLDSGGQSYGQNA